MLVLLRLAQDALVLRLHKIHNDCARHKVRIITHETNTMSYVSQVRIAKDCRHPLVQIGHFAHHHWHKQHTMLTSVFSVYRVAHTADMTDGSE